MKEEEILESLEKIDNNFSLNDMPIHTRPIKAIIEFGKKHNISLPIVVSLHTHNHPEYPKDKEYITKLILDWYKLKYKNLLKCDFSPGKTIVKINNNLMIMRLPKINGSVEITWDAENIGKNPANQIVKNGHANLNVIDLIIGLTQMLAKTVSKEDSVNIIKWFMLSMDVFEFINSFEENKLIQHTKSDLLSSVSYIERQNREYGESKWSCLQATEKYLKAIIEHKGNKFPKHHNLSDLAKLADIATDRNLSLISSIQCTAGVRYGEEQVDVNSTFTAHRAALVLIFETMNQWTSK